MKAQKDTKLEEIELSTITEVLSLPIQFSEQSSSSSTTMENPPDQNQLSEEEQERIKLIKRLNNAMRKVFSNSLVVEDLIFDKLKLRDLKICRGVCGMWKETATKIILKKDCSQVRVMYDEEIGKFRKGSPYDGRTSQEIEQLQETYHLSELTKIVEKSSQFPSSTFTVMYGNLDSSEILDFFMVCGEGVKHLHLSSEDGFDILVNCPNLEILRVNLPRFENPRMKQIEFPQLLLFSSKEKSGFRFRNILAPNLQVLEEFDLVQDTGDVVKAGKIHTVKKLKLSSIPTESPPEILQEFLVAGPQIEVLKFWDNEKSESVDENWKRNFAGLLQQLLNLSKDNLKHFTFSGLGHLFENLKFPRFSRLTHLSIVDLSYNKRKLFPTRINLPETFPKLKIFFVCFVNLGEDANWDMYFPPPDAYRGQLTSVTKVITGRNCSQKCKEQLQDMCPNALVGTVLFCFKLKPLTN